MSSSTQSPQTTDAGTKKPDLPPSLRGASKSSKKVKLGGGGTSWELVYKRNKVERLKRDKFPLEVLDELPDFIEQGYEDIPEDDIVRLYWYGIVHDKPKVGSFMVRLKVPCGVVSTGQLRGVGKIAERYGDNYSELTTRMGIQLHNVRLDALPEVVEAINNTGLTNTGAEGDTVRNVTGCPLAGIHPEEAFDVRPLIDEVHEFFTGNRKYSDLPRKLKFTITACPLHCSGPEFHGIALLAVIHEGRRGYAVRAGGGLSSTPRMARDLRIFVPEEEALEVLRGITDLWNEDLKYRVSRPKSRIKFMVDDHGPDKLREMLEERLGRTFERLDAPEARHGDQSHLGLIPQKQDGLYALGYSVPQGWVTGDQLQRLADVLDEVGGHARFTRDQNFILADVPEDRLEWIRREVDEIGFSLERNRVFGHSVACTSHKYCNFSVAKTKEKAQEILEELDRHFGAEIGDELTIKVDGCPHACAQHWMGNIGLQGTTARSKEGERIDAYDVTLRGGTGSEAAIGKPLLRKVPTGEVTDVLIRLVEAWLEQRRSPGCSAPTNGHAAEGTDRFPGTQAGPNGRRQANGQSADASLSFQAFSNARTDAELKSIALGEDVEELDHEHPVTLRLSGPLVQFAGGIEQHDFRSARARTVRSLVQSLTRRYNGLKEEIPLESGEWYESVNLFLNEEDIRELEGLDTPVEAGDEVFVLPALSGG